MKKEDYLKLMEYNNQLEEQLKTLCNHLMKIKRYAARHQPKLWLSAGYSPDLPLTDDAQQGPMVTQLFGMVDNIRKTFRKG